MIIKSTKAREAVAALMLYIVLGALMSAAFILIDGKSFVYVMVIYHISILSSIAIYFFIYKLCDLVYRA